MSATQKLLLVATFPILLSPQWAISQDSSTSQKNKRVPLQASITDVQPMTGIVLWSDSDNAATDSVSLEYRYCGYDEIVQQNGQYDFSKIDRVLDEIAGRSHQAVLRFRFVYPGKVTTVPDFIRTDSSYNETVGKSENETTHFCDWSSPALQDFTLEFYSRFAKRYDSDPRIAFLQTGFGLWAEYHIYDGPKKMGKTFPSKKYQARFLEHLDQVFKNLPWSISVDAADYDYSPLEDNDQLLALNFGVFDDSFLCKQHSKENAVNWKTLKSDRWKRSPGGGEFSYYKRSDQKKALAKTGPNKVPFAVAAKQFHISYMIGNDQPQYRTMDEIKAAGLATGYRFRVTSAHVVAKQLKLKVTNEGVAPIYRDAFFAAGDKISNSSLKGLLPGENLECNVPMVSNRDLSQIKIVSDAILPTQSIQFNADLQ